MGKEIRKLWVAALRGSAKAYRKLGILFWTGKKCPRDRKLAGLCLDKAAEMGDEEAYFLYHRLFGRGKNVIDERSLQDMRREYVRTRNPLKKKRLRRYLHLSS